MGLNKCIWLYGLSGAGKTTLAKLLVEYLKERNQKAILLDGDLLRDGINHDLGFTETDRIENVRRSAEIANLFLAEGYWVIVAMISPLIKMRENNRTILKESYIEICIKASLDICKKRDPKGLYLKVTQKELTNFTGIDSPFEYSDFSDIIIDTEDHTVQESFQTIIHKIKATIGLF